MDVREGKNTLNYRSVNNFSPKNTKNIQFNQDLESLKKIDQQTADSVGDYFDRFVKSSKLLEGGRNEINQNNPSKFHFSENKESRQPRQLLGSKDGQFRTNEIPRLQEKIIQKRSNSRSKNSSSKKKNNKKLIHLQPHSCINSVQYALLNKMYKQKKLQRNKYWGMAAEKHDLLMQVNSQMEVRKSFAKGKKSSSAQILHKNHSKAKSNIVNKAKFIAKKMSGQYDNTPKNKYVLGDIEAIPLQRFDNVMFNLSKKSSAKSIFDTENKKSSNPRLSSSKKFKIKKRSKISMFHKKRQSKK
ncbi:unnamed protein product [Moneuplotes crassus]|uniref:Uncharacterized protein n=1 Tax=Euplotes crassus TaxID=5936 RepID=A0AAD1UM75_EUPCR|nr:unnamed protein product [Moneuplotes crassus]